MPTPWSAAAAAHWPTVIGVPLIAPAPAQHLWVRALTLLDDQCVGAHLLADCLMEACAEQLWSLSQQLIAPLCERYVTLLRGYVQHLQARPAAAPAALAALAQHSSRLANVIRAAAGVPQDTTPA